jgi:flagellar hook-basal body complex protein FliE
MTGEADLRDVVAAVNNAEVTLQTVMAIRDKVVDAYTQILRMPI